MARAKNTPLPRAKRPIQAGQVGHFWRANQGNFSRVPKRNSLNSGVELVN
jgi:hypothetical protein